MELLHYLETFGRTDFSRQILNMNKINVSSITAKVVKAKKTQAVVFNTLNSRVLTAKNNLIEEFDTHPVTQEILAGPDVQPSTILPFGYGNLFSFLGFEKESSPVQQVRLLLEKIHLIKKPAVGKTYLGFKLITPSNEDVEKESPMAWESGRSWIHAITYGIGTFSHYVFSTMSGRYKKSRSGTAIQVKGYIPSRGEYLTGTSYLFGMLGRFRRKFKK